VNSSAPPALGTRVVQTFVAPRPLFRTFHHFAPWVDVLALSTLVMMIAVAAQPDEVFLRQVEGAVNRRGEPVEITSPPSEITRYGRYLAMLSALVGHPLIAFGVAGLLTLIFTVLGRGRVDFGRYLALVSHALLIPALGTLIFLAIGLATGRHMPDLAALAPGDGTDNLAQRLLGGVNPFHLWMLVVLGVGIGELDARRSWGGAAALLVGLYLGLNLATAALL
jgi:hypothetical protein